MTPNGQKIPRTCERALSLTPVIHLRCYAELNDYLPLEERQRSFEFPVEEGCTVRNVIGSLGVPGDQVDLVLVNGESADFDRRVTDGVRMSLYPVFESFNIQSVAKVRQKPLREKRFVLDVHLGKLASHLRMLGFDAKYRNDYHGAELIRISYEERRTLLSKDRSLLDEETLTRCYFVKEKYPKLQLVEVMRRFDLFDSIQPFRRCICCNNLLRPAYTEEVLHRLPPRVREAFHEFQLCPSCANIYWKGSHYTRMQTFIENILHQNVTP